MTNIKLNVLFKKMQKDDKKEVLMFHVLSDELPHADELLKMPGHIVYIDVDQSKAEKVGAEFVSIQRDNKKTVLKFNVKRNGTDINQLYGHAGSNVTITLEPSQMSIEEFYDEEDREGLEYTANKDGTVDVAPGQMSMGDEE